MPIKSHERTFLIILVAVISLCLPAVALGFYNQSGDSSSGYGGCAVSGCHFGPGAAGNGTVEMWSPNLTILVNQEIDVYVNVTEWALTANMKVGVFLLRSLTADDSDVPSGDGWIIIQDPNGNENNYVQKIANASGETLVFRWHVRGPFSAGIYTLYARVHHGGGTSYWEENTTGLTFQVLPDVSVTPDLVLEEVFTIGQSTVGEEAVLYAMIFSNSSDNIGDVRVDFFIDGELVAECHGQTFTAMRFRNATSTWTPSASGSHTLRVVVDPLDQVEEEDETNNELSVVFDVAPAEPRETPGFESISLLIALILGLFLIHVKRRVEE
jgi:hypothetical protein